MCTCGLYVCHIMQGGGKVKRVICVHVWVVCVSYSSVSITVWCKLKLRVSSLCVLPVGH